MFVRFLIVFLLLAGTGFSQTFTGLLDGYYGWNFNRPASRLNGVRAFDTNHNEFSLNYAELAVSTTANPVGFRADIGFGDTASAVHAFEPATGDLYRHLQQAYITFNRGPVTADFGKFVTQHGAEVIETQDNWNYSRGILFTWAIPFYHFGARTTFAANDDVSIGAFLVNGWNNVKENNSDKTVGFQTILTPGALTFVGNYMVGNEQGDDSDARHLFDAIASVTVSPELSLMANYDYGMDRSGTDRVRWQGIALYSQLTPASWLKLTPRYEWFEDPQGFMTTITDNTLEEFTLTSEFIVNEGASFWAEYRRDWSNFDLFEDRDGAFTDNQSTVTFGLTYTLSRGTN